MAIVISWTKVWSASDDGTVLGGADLGSIQSDIDSHSHTSGLDTFLAMSDTPAAYTSKAARFCVVNTTSDAVEFTNTITNPYATHGLYVVQNGLLSAGLYGLGVVSSANQTDVSSFLFAVGQNNAASIASAAIISNAGTGHGLYIVQNTANATLKHGLYILGHSGAAIVSADSALCKIHMDNAASTEPALEVIQDGTGPGAVIQQVGVQTSGQYALHVFSNAAQVTQTLAYLTQNSASSTQPALTLAHTGNATSGVMVINNAGTGAGINISCSGNGAHIIFTGDPTVASPADGEMWFDGTNLKMRVGAATKTFTWS